MARRLYCAQRVTYISIDTHWQLATKLPHLDKCTRSNGCRTGRFQETSSSTPDRAIFEVRLNPLNALSGVVNRMINEDESTKFGCAHDIHNNRYYSRFLYKSQR